MGLECDSREVAARGALEILSGMRVRRIGIGTGSTVSRFIKLLPGSGVKPDLIASSSIDTALLLRGSGYNPVHPSLIDSLDVYIDGADEVDPKGRLLKGRGAALLGEKILASASSMNIFIVSEEKMVEMLGTRRPLPVEVVRDALLVALSEIRKHYPGAAPRRGSGKDGPVISDWGGVIIDIPTGPMRDPQKIHSLLKNIPGVVETGLFIGYTDYVVIGKSDCTWEVLRFERSTI